MRLAPPVAVARRPGRTSRTPAMISLVEIGRVWGVPACPGLPHFAAICRVDETRKVSNFLWLNDFAISWVAAHNPEVAGSSPAPAIRKCLSLETLRTSSFCGPRAARCATSQVFYRSQSVADGSPFAFQASPIVGRFSSPGSCHARIERGRVDATRPTSKAIRAQLAQARHTRGERFGRRGAVDYLRCQTPENHL
jgi:hypothetical protein